MLEIKEYEKIIETKGKEYDKASYNHTLFWAYRNSKGSEMLNFGGIIEDKDIEQIAALLRKFGIKEFTISNEASGLVRTLSIFNDCEIKM